MCGISAVHYNYNSLAVLIQAKSAFYLPDYVFQYNFFPAGNGSRDSCAGIAAFPAGVHFSSILTAVSRAISIIWFMELCLSSGVRRPDLKRWSEMVHRHRARFPA